VITSPRLNGAPWQAQTLVGLLAAQAIAAVWFGVCWVGSSTTVEWSTQAAWLVAAVGGVVGSGLSAAWWLLVGHQEVRRRQRALTMRAAALDGRMGATRASIEGVRDGDARVDDDAVLLVSGHGMTRFHRSDCQFADDRPTLPGTRSEHLARGREACGVCLP
jgi:hypothetical protein